MDSEDIKKYCQLQSDIIKLQTGWITREEFCKNHNLPYKEWFKGFKDATEHTRAS